MVKALEGPKPRKQRCPLSRLPVRGGPGPGSVYTSLHKHTALCVHRYIFTRGALDSCLALSAADLLGPVGVGAPARGL